MRCGEGDERMLELLLELLDGHEPRRTRQGHQWLPGHALYQELAGPSAYRLLTESEIDPVIQSLQQLWDEKEG